MNKSILWTLPQPLCVFTCTLLAASAFATGWMDGGALTAILLLLPLPLCWMAERLIPKREDWLLNRGDFLEDLLWVGAGILIWVPLYERYYDSPIANYFTGIRESLGFNLILDATSTLGLVGVAVLAAILIEFISYWAHRLQHRYLFLWRIHATHHHITKMSIARSDRTHPLEFLGLNLGSAMVMAFFGATPAVAAVTLVLRLTNARLNHCNLPFRSGVYGWLFTTAERHTLHHSSNHTDSNHNYGCVIILWDRLFGTFSDKTDVPNVGNGTGEQLSLATQLALPFYSNRKIREL